MFISAMVKTESNDLTEFVESHFLFCFTLVWSRSVLLVQLLVFHKDSNTLDSQWCQIHHYNDVIMSAMASQITSLTSVYSTVYSRRRSKKHRNSAWLAFVRGIHRWPVYSPHKGPVTRKMFFIWWRHHNKNANIRLCSIKSVRDELNIDA